MAVVQVPMEMSAKASLGIANGTMKRCGGVVYNTKGGIVEHLTDAIVSTDAKEVLIPTSQSSETVVSTATKYLKDPKVLLAIGLGIVLVGGVIYYVIDKAKKKEVQKITFDMPQCIADYNDSVIVYLDAISRGSVSLDKINCVIKNVDALKENKEITFDFAQSKSETLVNFIYDYTKKLAETNSHELTDFEKATSISADNVLIYLNQYLEIQKQIFEEAV